MSDISLARRDGVLAIEFRRPQKKNALTAAMYEAMTAALAEADADDGVRVLLFHGQPEVFTAGNDLEDFMARPPASVDAPVFRFLQSVCAARKPLVAAVNGPAVGLGTTLLLHCDLVYAGDNARFSMPFTSLGLVPEFASSYLLPMIAGYQRAAELLLLGQPFTAEKAREVGIVSEVVSPEKLMERATQACEALAALPPESIRLTKSLMKKRHAAQVRETIAEEIKLFGERLGSAEAKEAMSAFLEKRKPDFSKF